MHTRSNSFDIYACPVTHEKLAPCDQGLQNLEGVIRYPYLEGLPSFLIGIPDENDEKKLRALRETAILKGWQNCLREIQKTDQSMHRYVTDKSRLIVIEVLPREGCDRVLEIGCGLGQFTFALARKYKEVYVLEVVPGQAAFVKEVARQEKVDNVSVAIGGDDCRLPYLNDSFDLIFLNLIFEWCASRSGALSRIEIQNRLLSECYRVLRRGGMLYLSTKNRYALRLILGLASDEHVWGMRFGNALPRIVLDAILRLKGMREPPGILHSHDALKKMLEKRGFRKIESYWAVPEMRYPEMLIPADRHSIRKARRQFHLIQGDSRFTRFVMPLLPADLVKHFAPGLTFLAQKLI